MPVSHRRFAAVLCLVSFPIAGCSDDTTPEKPAAAIAWADCGGGFECATFDVPYDHDAPDGRTFTLPLVRRPARNPEERIGSILVNPGGPGGSGVAWVRGRWVLVPAAIGDRFDLVGFDPRGQAGSKPSIDCSDDLSALVALDLTPSDANELQSVEEEVDKFVQACQSRSGEILPFVGTDNVVRDMDLLRQALGDEKLTYLGFSYGTFIGTMYADRYPDRVRALVLDSALDPSIDGLTFIEEQGRSFEAELNAFLADCATDTTCAFYSGGDPAAAYDAILASIEMAPMPAGDRVLGPGEFAYAVSAPLYQPSQWKRLAEVLALAATGDGSGLLEISDGYVERSSDGTYGDSLEVYYGVISIDSPYPAETSAYETLANKLEMDTPRLGAYFPFTALPSGRWPTGSWRTPGPVSAEGAAPILVVGNTSDPATPHAWGVSLANQLSSGVLVTREGHGHIAFLRGNTCVDTAVTNYLVDLVVPEDGTICK
jgi:pimeloyl-ACP methyl ester carboxylesterase